MMDELLEQFFVEARDLVAEGHAALGRLASDGQDAAAIDTAFRAVHTLKGSVAIVGWPAAEQMLHAAEDVLAAARAGTRALDGGAIKALTACLDQTDRWIDEAEGNGAPGPQTEAAALIEALSGTSAEAEEWSPPQALTAAAGHGEPLVAFRYAPDADCFFRGEDPLALVAALPELRGLAITPVGDWPSLADWDPFRCVMVIEGISAAPIDVVRAAFRLAPDQVRIVPVAGAAPAAASAVAPALAPEAMTTVRVAAKRLDALGDNLGELIVAANAVADAITSAEEVDRALAARLRTAQIGIDRAIAALGRTVTAVRRVPLAPAFRRLPRAVREVAAALGKPARLQISGDGIEVDKQIADAIHEPLLHLVRNAVDHGLEDAETRRAAGKSAEGTISLTVSREGEDVIIALSDDGDGIDADAVRAAAVARGLVDADAAASIDETQALQFIFAPGFSTATAVSEVSGRGVGMDAVRAAVEALHGRIEIVTARGIGTTFRLRLPASAITTRLLLVEARAGRYGVPLDQVVETVRIDSDKLVPVGGGTACVHRGRTLPVLALDALLGASDAEAEEPTARLLISRIGGELVALRVGRFGTRIDAVVRPRGGLLTGVTGVSGTAVLGNGEVLLVLDLAELAA